MTLLDRLAHTRALDRLGSPGTRADPGKPPKPRPSVETRSFERRELALSLEPAAAGPRSFAQTRNHADDPRSSLVGGCLARLQLPTGPKLARDLVCLGAEAAGTAVFIDTETTGLGAQAFAWVVGIAWIEGPALRCVQWTLNRCSGEAELLAELFAQLDALGPAPLVSFNGASFDLPLLRTRARRHGLSARVLEHAHIDLLHPARRLQQGRSGDCKLGSLERELLGVRRRGDIESADIPEVFWAALQAPEGAVEQRRREAVCDHNLVDLATLPALAAWLAQTVREPGDLDRALRASRHLERVGAVDQARLVLARWVEATGPNGSQRGSGLGSAGLGSGLGGPRTRRANAAWREAALELATLERRAGDTQRAALLWRWAWEAEPGCPVASEAWAKCLEHQLGDLAAALRVARGSRDPCAQRIARLEARLARRADDDSGQRSGDRNEPAPVVAAPTEPAPERSREPSFAPRLVSRLGTLAPRPVPIGTPPPVREVVRETPPVAAISERPRELLARVDETETGAVVRYRLLR